MNKAFVKEPESDGKAFCPVCGSLGTPVVAATLDAHLLPEARVRLGSAAFFCPFERCSIAYFNDFEASATVEELTAPVYPKDQSQPICACFGLTLEDVEADVASSVPVRIRKLRERTQSSEARCQTAAADGQCCLPIVQKLYMRLRNERSSS